MFKSCLGLKGLLLIFTFCLLVQRAQMLADAAVAPTPSSPVDDKAAEKLKIPTTSTAAETGAAAKETRPEVSDTMNDEPSKTETNVKTDAESNTAKIIDNKEKDWWKRMVLYQIYPRSFLDTTLDGIGDIKGIIMKLPYFVETGIQAILLGPVFQSPMVDFGYDVTDLKKIQPEYGTMQDLETLITEANLLGIKIIMDFVPNHSSNQSGWFQKSVDRESGYEDFYIWADAKMNEKGERMPPNNWQSLYYGPAWTWNEKRGQYYLHQFASQQPDLNYREAKVVLAIDDVLKFWLEKGVNGIRMDSVGYLFEDEQLRDEPRTGKTDDTNCYDYTAHIYTKHLPDTIEMVQHWRRLLDDYTSKNGGPTRVLMTDAYADVKTSMEYYETSDGKKGAHIPLNLNLITLNEHSDARDYVFVVKKWLTYMPRGFTPNWVMGNHNNPRMATRLGPKRIDSMHMIMMTLPGVAVTYYGDEIGMQDYRDLSWENTFDPLARNAGRAKYRQLSRDPERTPFQWDSLMNAGFSGADRTWMPVHPNYKNFNLKQQTTGRSHYLVYKALTEMRKMPALSRGRLQIEAIDRDILAIEREVPDDSSVLAVINIGPRARAVNLTAVFDLKYQQKLTVLVASSLSTKEAGKALPADALALAPYEGLVCMIG
ncbi:maltase 2-like [Anastrepha ludens]|uniref:maltase 2-like n=1 Tax=Anastrepha ludens TaxID=28586 RepID=UPI0023B1957B|nr:maltase 2-like [Anastrepha ludens]